MIKLIKGSIFDSKCDLIIIPCNSYGGINPSIVKELKKYSLPIESTQVSPGNICFFECQGSSIIASIIGYAASVDSQTLKSNKDIVINILRIIKNYCKEQSISKVNIPLIGTGAGQLDEVFSYNLIKQEFENSDILLCVYVLSEEIYFQLNGNKKNDIYDKIQNPRVFISYSWNDKKNKKWVMDLACRLRAAGVNARLDRFHLRPGQDSPQWMTNEILMADKVLLICDKSYICKIDNNRGGVGWENMIIRGDMLFNSNQDRYIVILHGDEGQELPVYLKSKFILNWPNDNQSEDDFKELLFCLFDCDIEPPIGEIPDFIKEKILKKYNV